MARRSIALAKVFDRTGQGVWQGVGQMARRLIALANAFGKAVHRVAPLLAPLPPRLLPAADVAEHVALPPKAQRFDWDAGIQMPRLSIVIGMLAFKGQALASRLWRDPSPSAQPGTTLSLE
eukprot:gene2034-biopygen3513